MSAGAQSTDTVLMVRPAAFGHDRETAASNAFQRPPQDGAREVAARAIDEFDAVADALRTAGVTVLVMPDSPEPRRPDAVFPNNWFTTHADGSVLLYPMLTPSRRIERRPDALLRVLDDAGYDAGVLDTWLVREFERTGKALEGTGSLVLDRVNRVAYACRSPRTDPDALARFVGRCGYERGVLFDATDADGVPYYHTNVMMSLGADVALVCLESVEDDHQRSTLRGSIESSGRRPIEITRAQAASFAGNALELRSSSGERLLAMSDAARRSLTNEQAGVISDAGLRVVSVPIPTIESVGGGSVRCMIAEVFLPRKS